jgi:EmrB/QacA subfamily drug resistance transporter
MLYHIPQKQKLIIMIAVMSGLLLAALDQTIVGTALPKILGEFNALKELSWVITAYLLTSTITVPISGKLSDLYGRRKLLIIGIGVFMLASLLCGTAQDINQLIVYRGLQGIGGGILFANSFAIIGDLFAARERAKWQGIIGAVFGISSLIGPLLGGYLSDPNNIMGLTTNWRWTFLINIPVAIVAITLISRFMPSTKREGKQVIDYTGATLLAVTLGSLVLACSLGGTDGWAWDSLQIIGLFVASLAGCILFVLTEKRAKDPILPLHFFKNPVFNVCAILFLMFGMAFFGAIIYIPTFAQLVLGYSATNSGIILMPMVIALSLGSAAIGQIVHKTGRYKVFVISGLAIATLGIYFLSGLNGQSTYTDLSWRMAVAGVGLGMAMPIFSLAVQNALPHKDLGAASSSSQLFRSIGSTVGLAIMGGVMNNLITQKLSTISSEPFVKFASTHGQGALFKDIDVNTMQAILSPQAQTKITAGLQALPPAAQQPAIASFQHLVTTLQSALSSSITQIFIVSACVMGAAVIVSFALKEVPLKNQEEIPPIEPA